MTFFDRLDRVFIERRPSDLDTGRRAKPIEDAGTTAIAASGAVNDEGVFVAPLISREPQRRQAYFLFCPRVDFTAVVFAARLAGTDLRRGATAGRFLAAALTGALTVRLAGAFAATGSGARRGSEVGAR
jgi:hypothetical protein